jgi:probable rRNA maturation factor
MIHVDSRSPLPIQAELVERAARSALEHESAPPEAELTIVLAGDEQLRRLNLDFLGVDAPTDVLSFPASGPRERGESDPESGVPYLGDVLISVPRAADQARAAGHAVEAEVQLLVVHGILHLLGYDHAGAREKARMWAAQAEILAGLGLSRLQVHE